MSPNNRHTATLTVEIKEESASEAKKKAIQLANRGFVGLTIKDINYTTGYWSVNNFPDLKVMMERL